MFEFLHLFEFLLLLRRLLRRLLRVFNRVWIYCAVCFYSRRFQIFRGIRRPPCLHCLHCLHCLNGMLYYVCNIIYNIQCNCNALLFLLLHGTLAHAHAQSISGTGFNRGPAFFARKPVMLLIRHFFQHKLGFATICALEFS